MKTKLLRRAFTLVELVIVIAVIAILAAVLIPTFSNVIENAHVSSDTTIVKNINMSLQIEEVNNGKKSSFREALQDAAKGGYTVEKITPTSNGDIVWDEDANRFALIKKDKLIFGESSTKSLLKNKKYKLWKITQDVNDLSKGDYSYYLSGNSEVSEVDINTGFDAGDNLVKKINLKTDDENKEIKIYTNYDETELSVNAPNLTCKHYGLLKSVKIDDISNHSYEEYGTVKSGIIINKGRFFATNGCKISGGLIANPVSDATGCVILAGETGAEISSISLGDNYKIQSGSTSVQNDLPDKFKIENVQIDADTKESLTSIGRNKFDGGLGTINDPFQVANYKQLCNMSAFEKTQYYFKQTKDIIVTSKDLFTNSLPFNGIYDGDNHKIILNDNMTETYGVTLFTAGRSLTIKNLNLYSASSCLMSVVKFSDDETDVTERISLVNVNTYSVDDKRVLVNASNRGPFINESMFYNSTVKRDVNVELEKCTNYMDIQNTGTCTGVFWGGCFYYGYDKNVVVHYSLKDCVNKGDIYSDGQAGLVFGNASGVGKSWGLKAYSLEELSKFITLDNVTNYGVLSYMSNGGSGIFASSKELNDLYANEVTNNGQFIKSNNQLENKEIKVYYDKNGKLKLYGLNLDARYKYKLEITVPNVLFNDISSLQGRRFKTDLNLVTKLSNDDKLLVTTKSMHNALSYQEVLDDYNKKADARKYNIDPNAINYNYLFEGYCHMGYYVNSEGILTIVIEKLGTGKTYPKFEKDKIGTSGSFKVYAYNDEGYIIGYKVINQ